MIFGAIYRVCAFGKVSGVMSRADSFSSRDLYFISMERIILHSVVCSVHGQLISESNICSAILVILNVAGRRDLGKRYLPKHDNTQKAVLAFQAHHP